MTSNAFAIPFYFPSGSFIGPRLRKTLVVEDDRTYAYAIKLHVQYFSQVTHSTLAIEPSIELVAPF